MILQRLQTVVIGSKIDVISKIDCQKIILTWAISKNNKKIFLVNVHSTIYAKFNKNYSKILNNSNLALPDGLPIALMVSFLEKCKQKRIAGPDLMNSLIPQCEKNHISVYFYGSTSKTLNLIKERLKREHPNLRFEIYSPPFRELTSEEEKSTINRINEFGANIIFVGLGCPKQELWINNQSGKIKGVLLGVGAAFNFYAGDLKRAPSLFKDNGFEWLYRIFQEPKRLFFRYLSTNILFLYFVSKQIIKEFLRKKLFT